MGVAIPRAGHTHQNARDVSVDGLDLPRAEPQCDRPLSSPLDDDDGEVHHVAQGEADGPFRWATQCAADSAKTKTDFRWTFLSVLGRCPRRLLVRAATVIPVRCSCGTLVAAAQMFDAGKEIRDATVCHELRLLTQIAPLCRLLPHRHLCLAVSVLVALDRLLDQLGGEPGRVTDVIQSWPLRCCPLAGPAGAEQASVQF